MEKRLIYEIGEGNRPEDWKENPCESCKHWSYCTQGTCGLIETIKNLKK